MALRVPVVATRLAGIPEMVEEGGSGLLFRAGDGQGLRQAIETLIGDPSRRRSMGERGREIVQERFDVRHNAEVLLNLLKSIARPAEVASAAG
jgi:glycosyltransferase involved in cell wall biosynthesis